MSSVGSLTTRILLVALSLLVVPLSIQALWLIRTVYEDRKISQQDELFSLSDERLGLTQSWVADRILFSKVVNHAIEIIGSQHLDLLITGGEWVPVSQKGRFLILAPGTLGPLSDKQVPAQTNSAFLVEEWIVVTGEEPFKRALAIPKNKLLELLALDAPESKASLVSSIEGWSKETVHGGDLYINPQGRTITGYRVPDSNFYVISQAWQDDQLKSELQKLLIRSLVIFGVNVALFGGLTIFLSKRLGRPLLRLQMGMERASKGDWEIRLEPDPWAFELNRLSDEFNQMLKGLRQATRKAEVESLERQRYETEISLGKDLQKMLLPQQEAQIPGLRTAFYFEAAKDLGGDFYDCLEGDPSKQEVHMLCVADVSGKGLSACLFSIEFRAFLRTGFYSGKRLEDLVRQSNHLLCLDVSGSGYFITAWIAYYDSRQKRLNYVSAGHPMAILKRAHGSMERLDARDLAFGVDAETAYQVHTTPFEEGDVLLLFTDGLIEQINEQGEMYGEKRLWTALSTMEPDRSIQQIVNTIETQVRLFAGKALQHDDITILCVQAVDSPSKRAIPSP